jgi:hypothetical protein
LPTEGLEAALVDDLHRVLTSLNRSIYAPPLQPAASGDASPDAGQHRRKLTAVNDDGPGDRGESPLSAMDSDFPPWRTGRRRRMSGGAKLAVALAAAILVGGAVAVLPVTHGTVERPAKEDVRRALNTASVPPPLEPKAAARPNEAEPVEASVSGAVVLPSGATIAGRPALASVDASPPLSGKPASELAAISLSIDARPTGVSSDLAGNLTATDRAVPAAEGVVEERSEDSGLSTPPASSTAPELAAIAPQERQPDIAEPPEDAAAIPKQEDKPAEGPALGAMTVRSAVNMRKGPDNDAAVVGVVPAGRRVDVIECKMWCRIAFNGRSGWVFKSFLSGFDTPARPKARQAAKPIVADNPKSPCEAPPTSSAFSLLRQGFGVGSGQKGCAK